MTFLDFQTHGDRCLGQVLDDRYRVDTLLGRGGMGAVYRGTQLGVERPVAIKVLHAQRGQNDAAVRRFRRDGMCR